MEGLLAFLDWAFFVLVYASPVVVIALLMHYVPREEWTPVGVIAVICGVAVSVWLAAGFEPFQFIYYVVLAGIACGALGLVFRGLLSAVLPGNTRRMVQSMSASAAFGALVLTVFAFLVVFADFVAPFGERNVVGDPWQEAGTACKGEEEVSLGALAQAFPGKTDVTIDDVTPKLPEGTEIDVVNIRGGEVIVTTKVSGTCLMGTDNLGRDMLSRLIYGAQTTIAVALIAGVASFAIGMFLSFAAAVIGGWTDQVLSRINDMLLAIPTLVSALVVLAALPQSITTLVIVMALIDQTRVYRLGRAVAMDVVVQDFVEAARLRGEGWNWIIFREIMPNVLTPLIAEFGLRFAFAVLFLSTLSFLGLGIQPPAADWGGMVKDNAEGIIFLVPAALYPGAAIAILAVCVNLVVDWLLNRTASLKGGRG